MDIDYELLEQTALARWVYNNMGLLRDERYGPYMKVDPWNKSIFEYVQKGWSKVFEKENYTELTGVIDVKSPWHAVLLLESVSQRCLSMNERVIFRGQSDSTWDIIASIDREKYSQDDKLNEMKKAKLFSDIMAALSFNSLTTMTLGGKLKKDENSFPDVRVSPGTYYAGAQHYGIATDLIDWTPDAAVATWFAAEGAKSKPGKTASIFVLSVTEAMEHGFEILVPPPFIERLHLQRGFFVKAGNKENAVSLKELSFLEVRFPCDFYLEQFDLIRTGIGIVDLLPESEPLNKLVSKVNELLASVDFTVMTFEEYKGLLLASTSIVRNHFNEIYHNIHNFWDDYAAKFEHILFWTCYKELGTDIFLDEAILKNIMDSNKDLAASIIRIWKYKLAQPDNGWDEGCTARIKLIVETAMKFIDHARPFESKTYLEGWEESRRDTDGTNPYPLL